MPTGWAAILGAITALLGLFALSVLVIGASTVSIVTLGDLTPNQQFALSKLAGVVVVAILAVAASLAVVNAEALVFSQWARLIKLNLKWGAPETKDTKRDLDQAKGRPAPTQDAAPTAGRGTE